MTIGLLDRDLNQGNNLDFETLIECKNMICKSLNLSLDSIELSMGMSNDFEHAVSIKNKFFIKIVSNFLFYR